MRLHTKGSEDSLLLRKTGPLEIGGQKGPSPPLRFWAEIKAKPFPLKKFPRIFRQSYGPENGVGVAVFEGTTQYSIRDEKFPIIFHMLRIN